MSHHPHTTTINRTPLALPATIDLREAAQELLDQAGAIAATINPADLVAHYDQSRLAQVTDYVGQQLLATEPLYGAGAANQIHLLLYLAQQSHSRLWYRQALRLRGDFALFATQQFTQALADYETMQVAATCDRALEDFSAAFVRFLTAKLAQGHKADAVTHYQAHPDPAHLRQAGQPFAALIKQAIDQQTQRAGGLVVAQQLTTLFDELATLLDDEPMRALAWRAQGNVYLYQQSYQEALTCYDRAVQLYNQGQHRLSAAEAEVGVVGALTQLGKYKEAEAVYTRISAIFTQFEQWRPLAKVTGNLAISYNRLGRDYEALALAAEASRLFRRLGDAGLASLPLIENNRAISLRNLGRFGEAIAASQDAYTLNCQLGQTAEAARSLQTMAFTYFLRGHYNRALQLYEEARQAFLAGGRIRDALAGDLEATDCLLQLRRFDTVLQKCTEITQEFRRDGVQDILLRAYMNQATAYAGKRLPDYAAAMAALAQAQALLPPDEQRVDRATLDLNRATLLYLQGKAHASRQLAQQCAYLFQQQTLPVNAAYAWLMAARAAFQAEECALAEQLLATAQQSISGQPELELPLIRYQAYSLAGALAEHNGAYAPAYQHYAQALAHLERLRGRIMVEFTSNFLEDKLAPYEQIVTLLLTQLHATEQAWLYAERAKSRALVDLLANRIDLRVRPRNPADVALVEQLTTLQAERSRLYRRRQTAQALVPNPTDGDESAYNLAQTLGALENTIEDLWNTLLTRNADYERDTSATTVTLAQIQSRLGADSCLIEYFIAKEQLFVFLITANAICAYPLTTMKRVRPLLTFWQMNLDLAPRTPPARLVGLIPGVQGVLRQLYDALLQPIATDLAPYQQWVIAPHGPLHALPFHALFDGAGYVVERVVVSYTPSATVWYFAQQQPVQGQGALILAHTQGGTLPGRAVEGKQVQQMTGGVLLCDQAATVAAVQQLAPSCRLLHLATHGRFQSDNPLFSGLSLEDGELTTFDIFNLQLSMALVVLSACETARAKVSSGDELLGLSRAFLYAGAQSLLLSQWKVADTATQQLMAAFYQQLLQGVAKGQALRAAQQTLLHQQAEPALAHPFFWSALFLIGDTGVVTLH
jgi:CHAT domain-containing protein